MPQTQISAYISRETKERLERFARAHGLKKAHLIETALQHHLEALEELPADVIIPARIVVSRETGERILRRIRKPPEPTAAMKKLFSKRLRRSRVDAGS
ncbi:MAG: hypothetical protein ACE5I7_03880 [Candidatus Binatia bacterium]